MKALEGIRVLDLSQFLSGPRCTQILSDLGAEVIKIEPPQGETMRLLTMMIPGTERVLSVLHRNKKGITLNLRKERGVELLIGLIKKSDVLVENFTPGTMDKLGLVDDVLKEANSRLIYATVSGFGLTGPLRSRTAFDIIAQATGGIMSANLQPDRPPRIFFGDLVSGAFLAIAIIAALFQRTSTGKGQRIDLSMQDVMYYHNYPALSKRAIGQMAEQVLATFGRTPDMLMSDERRRVCFWNVYRAKDGNIALVAITDEQWKRMVEIIGIEELKDDSKYGNIVSRILNSQEGIRIIEKWAAEKTVEEIVHPMDRAGVPCGKVNEIDDVNSDQQLIAREMLMEIEHPRLGAIGVPGSPIKLSDSVVEISAPAPELGEHNLDVYSGLLGMEEKEIEMLKQEGVL